MEMIQAGAGNPFLLSDDSVYVVQSGRVEVYIVRLENGQSSGRRRHLFTAEPGQALFGLAQAQGNTGLLACGFDDAELLQRQKSTLFDTARQRQDTLFAEPALFLVESWILDLWAALFRQALPNRFETLTAGQRLSVRRATMIRPDGDILWVAVQKGHAVFCSRPELIVEADTGWFPLTRDTWLEASEDTTLTACHSVDLLDFGHDPQTDVLWQSLDYFHQMVLAAIEALLADEYEADRQRLADKDDYDNQLVHTSFQYLSALGKRIRLDAAGPGNELLAACRKVAEHQGIDPSQVQHPPGRQSAEMSNAVNRIAEASHFRARRILLRGKWYQEDNGPLLGFYGEDKRPMALVPDGTDCYQAVDPTDGSERLVTEEWAGGLQPHAYMFYRPLPAGKLSGSKIIRFAFQSASVKDIAMLVLMAVAGGLLSLATPLAIGVLFDTVIPSADKEQHGILIALLVTGALASLGFQITRSAALVRAESKMNNALQAAVWDRLLNLPVTFFRQYTTGDLANRANGINAIRQLLGSAVMANIFFVVSSLFNLVLLFYYSIKLALIACALVLVVCLVFFLLARLEIRYKQQLIHLEGKITGVVLQIIAGIGKFRVAAAENRAYYLWAKEFGQQRGAAFAARKISAWLAVFNSIWPTAITLIIFYAVTKLVDDGAKQMPMPDFLAFNSALAAFTGGTVGLTMTFMGITDIFPVYERVKPILEAEPEVDESKLDPGSLRGDIEVSCLQFRYTPESDQVLKNVSLKMKHGQFVAIVGTSGSGKSTLLRLLLGFNKPGAGSIYYDGQDMAELNIHSVRSQIGVVLQNGQLMAGDIFTNIVGSLDLTHDDAWKAAAMAGLDADIRAMPMGMHTVIAEGASTISGGQRQRILIARAIVNRPRIIFFDEATSALDNRTQAIVSQSLERLKATRLVIAHRLSTIIKADMIYVMDKGMIVESGKYDELMQKGGVFANLTRRQIV